MISVKVVLGHPKRKFLFGQFGQRRFKLLDVGAGNDSCTYIKEALPNCEYHGIDRVRNYSMHEGTMSAMHAFYQLDLEELEYSAIPGEYFDAMLLSHVIEHLKRGDDAIKGLCKKLKKGGMVYVEWPHPRSMKLPSFRGTLNFNDDPTHVKLWSSEEVREALEEGGVQTIRWGTRRNWAYIFASPALILFRALKRGTVVGADFWDHLGFAQFVTGKKR